MIKKLLKGVIKIFIPKRLRDVINNLTNLDKLMNYGLRRELQQQNLRYLQSNDYVHSIVCVTPNLTDRKIIKFYCPDYPKDLIQCDLVDFNSFFAYDSLLIFNQYIEEGAVILDIGGNIGNHSLYWATVRKAQKIISFEPYPLMYDHFMKHIQMNELSDIITVYNKALGSENSKASSLDAILTNFGGSSIEPSDDGNMEIVTLDSLDLQLDRIDFVKIDVEGFELEVLKGARQTLLKYKFPTIALEIRDDRVKFEELYEEITTLLTELGYVQVDITTHQDYIFKHKDNL